MSEAYAKEHVQKIAKNALAASLVLTDDNEVIWGDFW